MSLSASIAIIELYQHDEVLRHYCEMLFGTDYRIKIFCNETLYHHLKKFHKNEQIDFFIKADNQSFSTFLDLHRQTIQQVNLVFITTALNNFSVFYKISKLNKTLLLVHNVHSFLAPSSFLQLSNNQYILDRLRLLKIYLNRDHFYKRKLLENLYGLIFPTPIVLDYVNNNFKLSPHLKLATFPFAFYQNQAQKPHLDHLVITIPCTVTAVHRDYQSVLTAFKSIQKKLTISVQILLLGRPKGDGHRIVADFEELETEQFKITSFKNTIPHQEYESWLAASDFLLLPLKQYSKNHIYKEHLGYSKISGGINDMIRFGIPALIPEYYPLGEDLEKMVERYNPNSLAEKLLSWINQGKYIGYKNAVDLALDNYSKEKMRLEFSKKIDALL